MEKSFAELANVWWMNIIPSLQHSMFYTRRFRQPPVIPATREAEIGGLGFKDNLGKSQQDLISKNKLGENKQTKTPQNKTCSLSLPFI
jgi:hypothetical protein